ncbi:MAG: ABC transporter permease [Deltaproteobacteria bacterium]|nr:MAG: ABC transporter permease [Deltaproteobacteria bacterium]UCH08734.1 MAG: ABC transporter permease [Deltaproteobacteria bacterium]
MRISFLRYFFRQALGNIFENRMVHLIGVGTMVIAFLIFDAFVLAFVNMNAWTQERGRTLTMSIYFKGDPDRSAIEDIQRELLDYPVSVTRFISKQDAMKSLRRQLGERAGLLDGLKENPLPASLEIILSRDEIDDSLPYELKKKLEGIEHVDEVQYSQEWIDRIQAVLGVIEIVGLVFGGLLFLAALFIVTNTIKLTIYSRKDEIEILKLVGATNGFVKAPFLIEGSIQGFLGGSVAMSILFLGYILVTNKVDLRIGFGALDLVFLSPEFILLLVATSVIAGLIGSTVSLGRFFRI